MSNLIYKDSGEVRCEHVMRSKGRCVICGDRDDHPTPSLTGTASGEATAAPDRPDCLSSDINELCASDFLDLLKAVWVGQCSVCNRKEQRVVPVGQAGAICYECAMLARDVLSGA